MKNSIKEIFNERAEDYLSINNSDKSSSSYSNKNSTSKINLNIYKSIKKIGEHTSKNYKKIIKNNIKSNIKCKIKKKYTAEFITEIQNIFISFGTNNELIFYNNLYEKISTNQTDDWIYNILPNYIKICKIGDYFALSKKKYINLQKKINLYIKQMKFH